MPSQSSFLPSDEVIFERSKLWSNFLSHVTREENYQELYFDEIPSDNNDDESESEVNENDPVNNCEALLKVKNFEGSSSSDGFDVDDLLNETIPVIEERKRKWKESGMDRVLDTFDFNAITDKVGSWLRKGRLENCMAPNSSVEDEQIVHFENHQIHFNSDDSLQSADTAKYILSNRKPRATSCTTMTIKRFRYIKGKQKELQRKYNCPNEYDLDKVFSKKCTGCLPPIKSRTMSRAMSEVAVRPRFDSRMTSSIRNKICKSRLNDSFPKVIEKSKHEIVGRQKSRHRKRRSDTSRKRSVSSSSSSSSGSTYSNSQAKPRFRKVRKSRKINDSRPRTISSSTSTGYELSRKEIPAPMRISNQQVKLSKSPAKAVKTNQNSNLTRFLPENIVNSTALSNTKTSKPVSTKKCQLSPIVSKKKSKSNITLKKAFDEDNKKNDEKESQENEKIVEKQKESAETCITPVTQGPNRKILVYTPKNQALYQDSISDGCFKLTEEHLRKSIGEKAARRFIKFNAREFPWEFDSSSTVYFKLPADSESSHRSGSSGDSDEDILNMFGKQGELVELPW